MREGQLPVQEVALALVGVHNVQEKLRLVRGDRPFELVVAVFLEETFLLVVGLLVEHFSHPLNSRAPKQALQEKKARTEVDPVQDDADDLSCGTPAQFLLQFLLSLVYLHELFEDVAVEVVLQIWW